MLEDYRMTLTVGQERELAMKSGRERETFWQEIAPKMVHAHLEKQLNRMMGPVRGAFFDVFVSAPGEMRMVGSVSKRRRA